MHFTLLSCASVTGAYFFLNLSCKIRVGIYTLYSRVTCDKKKKILLRKGISLITVNSGHCLVSVYNVM